MKNNTNKFEINIDILLLRMPCSIVSLDLENSVNEYKVNMQIKKQQYNSELQLIMEENYDPNYKPDHETIY